MTLPSTIKAITIAKTGDPEVLEVTEQPFPKIEPGHVVVKIQSGGVNFIDTYFRKGLYPITTFPAVLGMEAAGTIVQLPTDEKVVNDPDFKKRGYEVGSKVAVMVMGVHAEFVSVPWIKTYPIPAAVSSRVAAGSLLQGLTAITFLNEAYNIQQGDKILVHTVAGGLGLILAQYAKYRGATVIGTTSTKEKAELAKAHGADHVILYKDEDVVAKVLELTGGEGVEAIFDGVGKDTFEANFKMIKRKGTIVSLGNASGAVPPFPPLKLTERNVKLLRPSAINYLVTPDETLKYGTELYDLIARGIIKINIYKEYPFTGEGVAQAQTDLVGGKSTGKLLIKIADE
ncbi:hypothetical protein JAAARDRAFT_29081 [Jaapia argillacea MUCL 33604]|uniref:Probable quinone oxidoreductase n=1 Tax=Jaapia argillacea MUCL 33604 TaxID=933084 RepID=A0A067Q7Q9_9AGAM|nr:hypothetical protein JAAARDRAFT_29081 [Jaapia argillacea MUCL 33604]